MRVHIAADHLPERKKPGIDSESTPGFALTLLTPAGLACSHRERKRSPARARESETRATGVDEGTFQFTSIVTDPLTPLVWAVIVTTPDRLPVTTPLPDTVAVMMLEVDQRKP